ncbi:hypothetical protein ACFQ0G_49620 [Streptomyces chiangmaiensis]|uniref:hypothetical protein n=1 Tax=Streptomyces chiangmaiensis TaxID=766497 RepID=UPI003379F85B
MLSCESLLAELHAACALDWSRAVIAGSHVGAMKGGPKPDRARSTVPGSGLGVHRWVVEQSFVLLHWFRRLRIRWEIRDDIHEAVLSLARGIICWRRLKKPSLSYDVPSISRQFLFGPDGLAAAGCAAAFLSLAEPGGDAEAAAGLVKVAGLSPVGETVAGI